MKCDRCGLQSDVQQAFSMHKHFLGQPSHFCPDCTVKRQSQSFIWNIAILAGCGLVLFAINPLSAAATILLYANLILICMIPLIIIHELAHAGVAKLVGLRAFGIMLGVGKTVWSGAFLGMDWVINILPIGGVTFIGARPMPHIRWKLFFVYLAGPASHLLMALGVFLLVRAPLLSTLWSSLISANLLLAILNLWPRKVSVVTGMQGTDGWHLFRVPFLNERELTKHYISYFAGEAMRDYAANDFNSAKKWVDQALAFDCNSGTARNILGIIQMARQEYRASRETFLQLLETDDGKEPGLHYILLNNVAYLDSLLHDPSLLAEADQLSVEALTHLPWIPAVIGTRGTVLIELGKLEDGIALLRKAMSLHIDKQGKALNACHLAIAELQRGVPDEAHKYLMAAKTLDPKCFLVPHVEAQMTKTATLVANRENPVLPSNPGALQ